MERLHMANIKNNIPRAEFPNPQFERISWQCLNGLWDFEIDKSLSGLERGLSSATAELSDHILVPYCPESKLSGVQYLDFMNAVWYARTIVLTEEQNKEKVFICFGAVDYECTLFVNGKKIGNHKGGYSSFRFDISSATHVGENRITLFVLDDSRNPLIPRGKQSELYHSHDCDYTRTTGIWQSVWLEFVPVSHLVCIKCETDVDNAVLQLTAETSGPRADLNVSVLYEGREMGTALVKQVGGTVYLSIPLREKHLWELGKGGLYNLHLEYGKDVVKSYFGIRSVALDGKRFLLNGKSVFQRLVLDQGFYPDGIYTAPTEADLIRDIELSMKLGFNGARLHQKVFEPRFLYHCDRLGYMVWGEFGDWGVDATNPLAIYSVLPEWEEVLLRDRNHPAIIGWCPFNETWKTQNWDLYQNYIRLVYHTTKLIDPSRPCIDTSGGIHVETEIYDVHDYEGNPELLRQHYEDLEENNKIFDYFKDRQCYGGQAIFVSEYGGITWRREGVPECWSYGDIPKTEEEFVLRFCQTTAVLMDHPSFFGICYTQLTDVEQEQNGLLWPDRTPKFDTEQFRKVLTRKAAIEEE